MKKKVALVLGGGGARGAAHIGVIRELEKQGYVITSIAGTSMGALIGGIYAAGKLDEYEEWLRNLDKIGIFNLLDFTLSKSGFIKADKVIKVIQQYIPSQKIEDLPINFVAVATDLNAKKEIMFNKGSLLDAIRASISIPLVIAPMEKNDTLFVDGGVLNPLPVNRISRKRGDILIAVDVNSHVKSPKPGKKNVDSQQIEQTTSKKLGDFQKKLPKLSVSNNNGDIGYFDLISETTNLMIAQISKLTLQLNPPDMLIEISIESCSVFDFHKAPELIDLGKKATINRLKKYYK